jgi:CRP/FNR family transcriptional regulator
MSDSRKIANCFTCQARHQSEWCVLTPDEVSSLDHAKKGRIYGPAEVIYHQGDPSDGVYCIESGLIGLRKYDADGNSALVRLREPGQTIGYRAFLTRGEHRTTAEVLVPSHVCFIPSRTVRELLAKNPSLGLQLLQFSAEELSKSDDRFAQTVTHPAKIRFLHILLVLCERFGEAPALNEYVLELPLSRQDLAALIGIAPETISRLIASVQGEHPVEFSGRQVRIGDVGSLFEALGREAEQ